VNADLPSVPDDIDALKAALIAARAEAAAVGAELAHARAATANDHSLIAHLKVEIEKLRRAIYGPRSERTARLLDQLELQLEEAEADATEDELAAEQATRSTPVKSFERKRPMRAERAKLSRHNAIAKALDYMLTRWPTQMIGVGD
jgi:transposase